MKICGCMQPYMTVALSMYWEGNSWAEYTPGFIFIIGSSYQKVRKIIRKSLYSNNTASWQGIYLVTQLMIQNNTPVYREWKPIPSHADTYTSRGNL